MAPITLPSGSEQNLAVLKSASVGDPDAKLVAIISQSPLAEVRAALGPQCNGWRDQTPGRSGWTLLIHAIVRRLEDAPDVCRLLIADFGFNVNHPTGEINQTPIFFAASRGLAQTASVLLAGRANLNHQDKNSQTALFWAVKGNLPVVKVLLANKADPALRDPSGQTPLFYAMGSDRSADPMIKTDIVRTLLLDAKARGIPLARVVDQRNQQTALFYAVQHASLESCSLLLEQRCAVNDVDFHGQSPLFYASGRSDCVEFLLRQRADVMLKDRDNATALLYAADKNQLEACRLLVQAGADPQVKNSKGFSPYSIVVEGKARALPSQELITFFKPPKVAASVRRSHSTTASQESLALKRRRPSTRSSTEAPSSSANAIDIDDDDTSAVGSAISSAVGVAPTTTRARRNLGEASAQRNTVQVEMITHDSEPKTTPRPAVRSGKVSVTAKRPVKTDIAVPTETAVSRKQQSVSSNPAHERNLELLKEAAKEGNPEQIRAALRAAADTSNASSSSASLSSLGTSGFAGLASAFTEPPLLHRVAHRAVGSPYAAAEVVDVCRVFVEEAGWDPDVRDVRQQSPLFQASAVGNAALCSYLVDRKCDVDATHKDGSTALFVAARKGHRETLETLLQCRADACWSDKYEQTPLLLASRIGSSTCVALLLAARASPSMADATGQTPLFYAASDGSNDVVRVLIEGRADANWAGADGRSPLYYAIRSSRAPTAILLLDEYQGRPPCEGDHRIRDDGRGNRDLFDMARDRGFPEIVYRLGKAAQHFREEKQRRESLFKAATTGTPETLNDLLAKGASLGTLDKEGRTVLHAVVLRRDEPALHLCRQLIEVHNADVNAIDLEQETPLFGAVREGLVLCVSLLLSRQCDLAYENNDGETALFGAVRKGRRDVVELLIRSGARPDHCNKRQQTALFSAVLPGCAQVISELFREVGGVQADHTDTMGQTALFFVEDTQCALVLIDRRCDVNRVDKRRRTALFAAAEAERNNIVEVLLEHRAKVHALDLEGHTALHKARGGVTPRLLLNAGIHVDVRDRNKQTPLFFAASRGDAAMIRALAQGGCDASALDINGQSPLFYAAKQAPLSIVRMLVAELFVDPCIQDLQEATAEDVARTHTTSNVGVAEYLACAEMLSTNSEDLLVKRRRYCIGFYCPSNEVNEQDIVFGEQTYDDVCARFAEAQPSLFSGGHSWLSTSSSTGPRPFDADDIRPK